MADLAYVEKPDCLDMLKDWAGSGEPYTLDADDVSALLAYTNYLEKVWGAFRLFHNLGALHLDLATIRPEHHADMRRQFGELVATLTIPDREGEQP